MILDFYLKILDTTMYIFVHDNSCPTKRLHFACDGIADLILEFYCTE